MILVFEPDVLVCVLVSLANVAVDNNSSNVNSFFISPPEENLCVYIMKSFYRI